MIDPTVVWLKLELESDATFGRGDGVAGLVDTEVQHDVYGLPYLSGKTLKGLLAAECAEILYAIGHWVGDADMSEWRKAAQFLFGQPGSHAADAGHMRVGDAQLPTDLRAALMEEFRLLEIKHQDDPRQLKHEWGLARAANLEALTALRRQTAMDAATGAPMRNMLRTMRVILRKTSFIARIDFSSAPNDRARWLLAACVKAFRRAGTGRHRGRGRLQAELCGHDVFNASAAGSAQAEPVVQWFIQFEQEVRRESANVSRPAD